MMRRIITIGWLSIPLLVWIVCLQHARRQSREAIIASMLWTHTAQHPFGCDPREVAVDRGLWTPPIRCDYLSPCRVLQDLQGENPIYPRALHHLVCPEISNERLMLYGGCGL